MRRIRLISPIAMLLLAPGTFAQTPAERFSIPGDVVAVYNLAGNVTIERGTGANVVIEVSRGGSDAARLDVQRIDANGRPTLVVRYPDGDVVYGRAGSGRTQLTVRGDGTFGGGTRGDRITIRSSGSGTDAYADLRILVPANRAVDVRLAVGDVSASDVEGDLNIDVHSADVRTLNTKGRLHIDTGSGNVEVNNAEGDEILVDTGSGNVEVNGIRASDVTVDTGSGRVSGTGIAATNLGVDTGSGSISLSNVSGRDIVLDTGSGRVEIDVATQVETLRIDTGSGGVQLTVPSDLSAAIEIDTGSGGIDVDVPVAVAERDRTSLIGTIGGGSGRNRIEIDTGSGGVRIATR